MTRKMPLADRLRIIEKVPFFHGLSPEQVQSLLRAGETKKYENGYLLCRAGSKSTEMFVLLAGELVIKADGVELARIEPVDIVGEMGMVTSQPRCADIEVDQGATVILIKKMTFDMALKADVALAARIYKNMLDALCQRLRHNNARLAIQQTETDEEIAASLV